MVHDQLWKNGFLTHFYPVLVQKTAHFQGILGFFMVQNASPRAQNWLRKHLFEYPEWFTITCPKTNFCSIFGP